MRSSKFFRVNNLFSILLLVGVVGCSHHHIPVMDDPELALKTQEFEAFLSDEKSTMLSKEEKAGLVHLFSGDLEAANTQFNKVIKIQPNSANGHFMAALTYHLMGEKGTSSKLDLASVGYDLAIKNDPRHAYAYYYRGILAFTQKNYAKAEQDFAAALLLDSKNPKFAYGLAVSAYYNHHLDVAAGAVHQALAADPKNLTYHHAAALIMAALGVGKEARHHKDMVAKFGGAKRQLAYLTRRLQEWSDFYKAQSSASNKRHTTAQQGKIKNIQPSLSQAPMADDQMVIVDVVLILNQETEASSRGFNLLGQLSLTFGNNSTNALYPAGFTFTGGRSYGTEATFSPGSSDSSSLQNFQHMVTQITVPAATYALNAARAVGDKNEMIARPSLLARHGKTSTFFSGQDLSFGFGSSNAVAFKDKNVGISLEITPHILEDRRVNLKIHLKRDFFTPIDASVMGATNGVQTAATRIESDVIMRVGETLILGGLSDRVRTEETDGTSGLQDIPLFGFLFKKDTQISKHTSIIILVTPHLPESPHKILLGKAPAHQTSVESEVLQLLREKHDVLFAPYAKKVLSLNSQETQALYNQLRAGDVTLGTWHDLGTVLPQVQHSLDYAY